MQLTQKIIVQWVIRWLKHRLIVHLCRIYRWFFCLLLVYGIRKHAISEYNNLIFLYAFPSFFSPWKLLFKTINFKFQVHVVDGSSLQPDLEFDAVRLELKLFNPELAEKPYIVAYNKMDLPEAYENWESFKEKLQSCGITTFCMSAVKREGTHEVICAAYELLRKSKEDKEEYKGYISFYTYSIYYCYIARILFSQRFVCIWTDFTYFRWKRYSRLEPCSSCSTEATKCIHWWIWDSSWKQFKCLARSRIWIATFYPDDKLAVGYIVVKLWSRMDFLNWFFFSFSNQCVNFCYVLNILYLLRFNFKSHLTNNVEIIILHYSIFIYKTIYDHVRGHFFQLNIASCINFQTLS